ncbi:tyrosine-type recombinase/integrase [Puniceibacterium confluentis]|uniref:tyrosine-type recombinase/integrase n=1 Tax=Puniceibacterium confluentis TaxID=1958944 RepID=UPI003563E4A2
MALPGQLQSRSWLDFRRPDLRSQKPARAKSDGHPTWTHDQIAAFRAVYPIGGISRAIFELTCWTGARISDACKIGPQHIGRDGVLCYRQIKTGDAAYVPWNCHLPRFAVLADLEQFKAANGAVRGLTFLQTGAGRPMSHKAAGHTLAETARSIGIERSAHGLRKTQAAVLAESGAAELEIGSWTGHRSLSEIVHYTREMNRRAAATGTHAEREVETPPTKVETPGGK